MAEPGRREDEAERLRRHWDGVVRGAPEPDGLDPALAETVRRLHALDTTAGPSRAIVDRIWGELMNDAATPSGPVGATMGVVMVPNGRLPGVAPAAAADAARRRPSPVAELATAAIVVLSVALATLAYRLVEREPGEGGASGVRAPVATVGGAVDVPGPEECRVAPRSRESALALLGDPAGRRPKDDVFGPLTVPPTGPPADAATVAAVTATIRELHACENARDVLRGLALNTDRHLRLGAYLAGGLDAFANVLATPAVPHPEEERSRMSRVRDVRVLPDGRVGAVVDGGGTAAWPDSGTRAFLVLARVGDRYLIDEELTIAEEETPTPATTTATSTTGAVRPEECRVAPRLLASIRRLDEAAAGASVATVRQPTPGPILNGPPADGETMAAVAATLREDRACIVAGNTLNVLALRTDAYLERVFARTIAENGRLTEEQLASLATPSAEDDAGFGGYELLPDAGPLRRLPDGRVGSLATMVTSGPYRWDPDGGLFLVFARVGDRYLIDEEVPIAPAAMPGAAAPTPSGQGTPVFPNVTPSPTVALAQRTPTPIAQTDYPTYEVGAIVVVIEDRVSLRESPAGSARLAAEIPLGARLEVTGPFVDDEPRDWWPVIDVATSVVGYVREDVVAAEEGAPALHDVAAPEPTPTREAINVDPTPTAAAVPIEGSIVVAQPTFAATATAAPVTIEPAAPLTVTPVSSLAIDEPLPPSVGKVAGVEAEAADLRATVAALEQEQSRVGATATALAADADATPLEPTAVTASVQVDADGLLVAEAVAEAAALDALHGVLDRYEEAGCRVGFALISAHGSDVAEGVALARATELLLRREFSGLFAEAAAESLAVPGASPRGRVDLELFLFQGCAPNAPSPTPAVTATAVIEPSAVPSPTPIPVPPATSRAAGG